MGDQYIGGNPWLICTLWLAIYKLAAGETQRARKLIDWVAEQATPLGLLPEQGNRETGQPTWVTPLAWSHAMFRTGWRPGTKAIRFDTAGRILRRAAFEYPLHVPSSGRAEQDPDEILQAVLRSLLPGRRRIGHGRAGARTTREQCPQPNLQPNGACSEFFAIYERIYRNLVSERRYRREETWLLQRAQQARNRDVHGCLREHHARNFLLFGQRRYANMTLRRHQGGTPRRREAINWQQDAG